MRRDESRPLLNPNVLSEEQRHMFEAMKGSPVTVLQIGEGNFLRGFVDWMLHECRKQGLFAGSAAVTQPRPSGAPKIEALRNQEGLYTLVTRGLENGERVERQEMIAVFAEVFDPYSNWEQFLKLAESPELATIISNTTEAGLAYRPEELVEGVPVASFPGKITLLLYRRFLAFDGAEDRGLILLPCELLERNGDELRRCVLQFSEDWGFPESFRQWVVRSNRFLNSLVDRIVTGYPEDEAEAWFAEWGYRDELLNTAEPYHFWAIEAEPELDARLPFRRAGLNVHWVHDLKPYQLRKVRILNGAHTLMTPLGILLGLEQVRDVMGHDELGVFVRETVMNDIIPVVPLPEEELKDFAAAVFERFSNPFIRHRLSDIAMNSISKFKVRLLPTLLYYSECGERIPDRLIQGFAALLRYYKVDRLDDGSFVGRTLTGQQYTVRDDAGFVEELRTAWSSAEAENAGIPPQHLKARRLLVCTPVWDQDLSAVKGLAEAVGNQLDKLEERYE
ncbi:tagaturonate reductase [Paenibacillus mendelii]|uniref:Tagaturonate reductase n=1 Tax=Paenibacillus mendelii TaxID=206163 RepID=A0ABV6J9G4_9BACL|nr:tagaturonate reductase [Paenibacillus mendelii]MCQ6559834.1 tagaturonate reductase [Paenibacillus mendelii]